MTPGEEVGRAHEIAAELLNPMPKAWARKDGIYKFAWRCAFRIVRGTMTMEQGHRNMRKHLEAFQTATLAGAVFNLPVICRHTNKTPEKQTF